MYFLRNKEAICCCCSHFENVFILYELQLPSHISVFAQPLPPSCLSRSAGVFPAHGPGSWRPFKPTAEGCVTAARFRTSAIGRHRGVGGTRRGDSALSHRTTRPSHAACCGLHGRWDQMHAVNSRERAVPAGRGGCDTE